MDDETENALVTRLAKEHSLTPDGVAAVLKALRSGGGTMAQFSHADFGGMSQWSSGMTMVGDMFNGDLKTKLNAVATDLATYLRENPPLSASKQADTVSYRSERQPHSDWWPDDLGTPNSVGSQNNMRYAVFPNSRRLAIDDHGIIRTYDTGDHRIGSAGQARGVGSTLTFTSQNGVVRVADLTEISTPPSM